jgi:TP901 family phage tail tape measure protein
MAKTITDEKIKLSIIIDGNPAQKELFDLEKSLRDLNSQQKELRKEKQLLEKQGLKETERYKAITASLKENTAAITANKSRMSELQKEIGLTGLTMGQLQSKATALRATLRNLIPGSADYQRYENDLKQVTARLDELRGKAAGTKFSIGSLADGFNRYAALGASVIATLTGVVLSIQKIIDINGKLSDAQADVMKTTGMTKIEVDELTKSFGLLQTRTSRIDLLKIAEQGGRIGILKEDIGEFVNVMNKAAVALGDSFTGGAEEVATKLGKIKFLFQETKDLGVDQAYNAIGSAINDLGANGVASEANIAEFTTRIGSLTDVLKPTIQETLALGTAFEESGIEAEVSSRAYNIFMKQAATESAKFAQVMGLTTQQVEAMINKNPLDFMMQFSEGMRGMDATKTAKTLEFLGINADGANKVIGAMGNNMGRFRELIDLSNNSFASGTSLINEYNIKNETLGASLEKIKKTVTGWFSSETFTNWLASCVSWLAKFIGANEDADGSVTSFRDKLIFFIKVLSVFLVSIVSYNAAIKLTAVFTRTLALAQTLVNVATGKGKIITDLLRGSYLLLSASANLVTGNIVRANAAMRLFNTTVKLNPLGIVLGALLAVGTAFLLFKSNSDKATASLNELNTQTKLTGQINAQFNRDFGKASSDLKARIEPLISILNNQNVSLFTRKKAYEDLIAISPSFQGTVDSEFKATSKLKEVYAQLLDNMKEKMRFEAMQKVFQSKYDQEAKALANLIKEETKYNVIQEKRRAFNKKLEASGTSYGGDSEDVTEASLNAFKKLQDAQKAYAKAGTEINVIENYRKKQIEALTQEQKKYNEKSKEWLDIQLKINTLIGSPKASSPDDVKSDFKVPGNAAGATQTKNPNSSIEELAKIRLDNERKMAEEILKIQRQIEDDKILIMQEGYEKEEAIEMLRYKREIEDLNRQKVNASEIAKLDEDIAKAKENGNKSLELTLNTIKTEWIAKNELLDKKAQELTEGKFAIHQMKLATIQEKGAKTQIELEKEAYDRAKVIRETKFQEELAILGNNQRAKEKLTREHNQNELAIEEAFLRELINKLNEITGKGNIGKIDLDLLTPEQVDQFKIQAEKAGLTLQELINKRNELVGGQASDNAQALGVAGSADILGFTRDNWDTFFLNLEKGKLGIDEMVFAVAALTNAYSMYNDFLSANENAQLKTYQKNTDTKKKRLKQQLDTGMINQHQYKKGIEKIDEDLEKKKADIEYKQAKRQKVIAAMNIINSTAQAIIGIWAQFPKFDFGATAAIMSGVVGALGALQLATVMRQPLPARGAEDGLYPDYIKREQDGKVFKTTGTSSMKTGMYTNPRLLVGEGPGDMPEMVIDKRSFAQISPGVKSALISELRGVRGFEKGYYDNLGTYQVPIATPTTTNNNDAMMQMVLAVVSENTAVMKDLRDKGVTGKFFRSDLRSMSEIDKGIQDYYTLKNKAKR